MDSASSRLLQSFPVAGRQFVPNPRADTSQLRPPNFRYLIGILREIICFLNQASTHGEACSPLRQTTMKA